MSQEFQEQIKSQIINPIEVDNDLSIIALVGSNMKNQVGGQRDDV